MSSSRRIISVLGFVLVLGALLVGFAPVAAAQDDPETTTASGSLEYQDLDANTVPVIGGIITVTAEDGTEVTTFETGADGFFVIELPSGGTYSFALDVETLPEGVSLADGAPAVLGPIRISEGSDKPITFRIVLDGSGGPSVASRLDRLPQLLFEGLKFGLIIAMSAVGLSLIFGTTGLVNFAHGELVTLGALLAYMVNVTFGVHLLLAAPIAVVLTGLIGAGVDRGFFFRLRKRGLSLTAQMIVTIGVSLAVRFAYLYQYGGRNRPFGQYAIQTDTLEVLGITMVRKDIVIVVVSTVLLVLVAIALRTTRIGKATRAVADNKDLAESSGIDVQKVILVVWGTGAALAAVGGVFLGLSEQVSYQGGFQLLLLMFAGVTLGGLGTAYGALVGCVVVGIAVQVSTLFIPSELKNVAALSVLIIILLVRPQGILGQAERVG